MLIRFLFIIVIAVTGCVVSERTTKMQIAGSDKVTTIDNRDSVIIISDTLLIGIDSMVIPYFSRLNKSTTVNVDSVKIVLNELITSYNRQRRFRKLQSVNNYKVQVVPYFSKENKKYLWVNCFCSDKSYWRKQLVIVKDGGSCYFNFCVDVESYEYSKIQINGGY
jgi:hypothetical protein